ncbi:family 16 glycosylhydrolase [Gillisia sp. JM1]|uniref:glycoside hydrolase family 16 protein n=1 Tax=Gillisia sp. JM1 TaxID=1283286 RepID=UPI00040EB1F3|nr:glycoside hydrolase family 16 protein [Gillisia sp. JM1]
MNKFTMKKKQILNRILLALTLSFILMSCDSSDDSATDGDILGRTKIKMEIPSQNILENYNWNDATLVWSHQFDDNNSFDENWVLENNLVSDQLQVYTRKNLEVSGGTLKISATKIGEGQNKGDYASSRITGKLAFQYGRIEISAKLPEGEKPGIGSKIGLIGDNINVVGYPNSGEIDIMEYFSSSPNKTYVYVHTAANNNDNVITANTTLDTAEEEFHVYGILWTKDRIEFYIDDTENIIYTLTRPSDATEFNWPFDQPFYLVIDMVVGGRYAGEQSIDDSMFPAIMEINYINVYHAQ